MCMLSLALGPWKPELTVAILNLYGLLWLLLRANKINTQKLSTKKQQHIFNLTVRTWLKCVESRVDEFQSANKRGFSIMLLFFFKFSSSLSCRFTLADRARALAIAPRKNSTDDVWRNSMKCKISHFIDLVVVLTGWLAPSVQFDTHSCSLARCDRINRIELSSIWLTVRSARTHESENSNYRTQFTFRFSFLLWIFRAPYNVYVLILQQFMFYSLE